MQRDPRFGGKAGEFRLELCERMPIAADERHHRKLAAEAGHSALADIAAAIADDFGEIVDETGSIRPDGRDGNVLLHVGMKCSDSQT